MKVAAKPIEVISMTDTKGNIMSLRLRIENKNESMAANCIYYTNKKCLMLITKLIQDYLKLLKK